MLAWASVLWRWCSCTPRTGHGQGEHIPDPAEKVKMAAFFKDAVASSVHR